MLTRLQTKCLHSAWLGYKGDKDRDQLRCCA